MSELLHYFGSIAAIDFGIQWAVWSVSAALKTDKFYDCTGLSTFILLACVSLKWGKSMFVRQQVQTGMVCAWATRLGVYLVRRIMKAGSDSRFDIVKRRPLKFLIYWTVQGVWILFTLMPTLILNYKTVDKPIGYQDYAGWTLWAIGFLFESIADYQKSKFRAKPSNKGKYIRSGLWSISRHPNYFGEILLWLGLYITAQKTMEGYENVSIFSPIFVAFLLIKVSGIPILEKTSFERWGTTPSYVDYVQSTAKLIPFIW
ncbi:uncharacterized protein LOC106875624 [Octopus bimaculoides]|uniref:Uncharacterized protein n=1 Tax=Octopus bimaculoides TaxID=37653 RepID=A0A0L8IBS6_OCTBM|nr:uncharacterized protein LOC106875624 [Octopus bimaculoides]|eukprot:XP_014779339.1 PREDICTED: uncharacterized protein LOC106875624 [Octopus bimaculoides]